MNVPPPPITKLWSAGKAEAVVINSVPPAAVVPPV